MAPGETDEVRLARLEEKVDAVKAKADSTQSLVVGILLTTLGTFLTAAVGLVMFLVSRS